MTPLFDISGPAGLLWAPGPAALLMVAVLLPMLALTVYRAWCRLAETSRLRQSLVSFLNVCAFAAVALLVAPPEQLQQRNEQVLLLTPGANTNELPVGQPLFALPGVGTIPGGIRVQELSLPAQLTLREPGLAGVEVRGHGLSLQDWQQLPTTLGVRFDPAPLSGPVDMQWTRRLMAGEPLRLAGRMALDDGKGVVRLVLQDPAGLPVADTTARSGQSFELTAVPKGTGRMTYQLQVWRGDTLDSESPVATDVVRNRGARLLVIQSAPSFDTRQLVNWAADLGQEAVVLTRISEDRDLTQGFNTPDQMPLNLDSELLRWADLVIMDGRRWVSLMNGQRQLILDEVTRGTGLVLMADAELAAWLASPENEALDFALQESEPDQVAWPLWPGGSPASPLPIAPWRLSGDTAHTLTGSEEGFVLEAWQAVGGGRIAISLLRERQSWFTEGQTGNATRYWSYLLRTLARPASSQDWLAPSSRDIVRVGSLFSFCIASLETATYRLESPGSSLISEGELVPHADGFPVACGWARASQAGWHSLQLADSDSDNDDSVAHGLSIRVYATEDWQENEFARRQAATLARAADSQQLEAETLVAVRARAFSPWWIFVVLLICTGLLWLERRLFDLQ